jgi:hypothetical protein
VSKGNCNFKLQGKTKLNSTKLNRHQECSSFWSRFLGVVSKDIGAICNWKWSSILILDFHALIVWRTHANHKIVVANVQNTKKDDNCKHSQHLIQNDFWKSIATPNSYDLVILQETLKRNYKASWCKVKIPKNSQSILKIKMFAPMSIPLFEMSCVIFSHDFKK